MEYLWDDTDKENLKYWVENLTNLKWTGLGLKPGLRGKRPAYDSLSLGEARIFKMVNYVV
jgi:hypothetical protein